MILVQWRLRGSLLQKPRCASANAVDRLLDRAGGDRLLLNEPRCAAAVRNALLHCEREKDLYQLRAWVFHHNHVHVLMKPKAGTVLIAETIMDASEKAAGRRFWERESWERLIRNEREEAAAVDFIEQHPVRLGLAGRPCDWMWSSAFVAPPATMPELERLRLAFVSPFDAAEARA